MSKPPQSSNWKEVPRIGLIPTDWKCTPLDKVCKLSQYGINSSSDQGESYPILRMNNLQDGSIDTDDLAYINLSDEEFDKYELKHNDLLVNRTNSYDLVGKAALFDLPEQYVFASYLVRFRLDETQVHPRYVNYYFNSHIGKYLLRVLATKGVSQANINPTNLRKQFLIPYPPLPEQRKIAEILGTWDKAIVLTERRIEAAQQRKNALMQQLLTGWRRFKEFEGTSWQETELGKFFYEFLERNKENKDLTVLSCSTIYGIVPQTQIFSRRIASENTERYKVVTRGDLIYDPMLLWDASIGFLEVVERGVVSPAYSTFKFKEENGVREYFKHLIKTHYLREHYKFISQGTNVRRRKAPIEAFLKLKVTVPGSKAEQRKIAAVLQACDREIALLTQKRDALQHQKKGLMQLLLIGRVRVTV